jgi:hypothetical protein
VNRLSFIDLSILSSYISIIINLTKTSADNYITGIIPSELSQLTALKRLEFGKCYKQI